MLPGRRLDRRRPGPSSPGLPGASDALEDRGAALATADAHRDQRAAPADALQLIDRLAGHASALGPRPLDARNTPCRAVHPNRAPGTVPVHSQAGSTPAWAYATRRAMGFAPRASAALRSMSTTAAAPSLMPEALPAVTVPFSGTNTGLSFARSSRDALLRTCSSVSKTTVPLRDLISIGRIWSRKRPSAMAAAARRWLSTASLSWSSRVM